MKAHELDANDSFQPLTHLFDMPVNAQGKQLIYLNGNSLGPKPKSVDVELMKECNTWGKLGVLGHFDPATSWVKYHTLVTHSLARLVGAKPDEVVANGTLTTNLHLLFVSFYRPTKKRFKIIRLAGFPSDTYAIEAQVKQRCATLKDFSQADFPFAIDNAIIEIKPDKNGYIDHAVFKKTLEQHGEQTAIIWIEAVHYLTGQYFHISDIATLAHQRGCKIGLDLAHAIGNVPLKLHEWNIDFAVWCSYKYLSAGPGGIAGLYVHEKYLTDQSILRFAGWWGHNAATRFQMPRVFDPILTAEGWQTSNAAIFLIAALRASLNIFDQVDLLALREKNKRLTDYLISFIQEMAHIEIVTPVNSAERGCQISLRIKNLPKDSHAEKILLEHDVVCDARGNLIRVAPMGLYTTFSDVSRFADVLKRIKKF